MKTTFEQRLGKTLSKNEKPKELVFLHGTGLNEFTQMAHEGVAPNISVAIRGTATDYDDFGDIIFSLNPEAFFDESGNTEKNFKIFSRDASTAYTPKKSITLDTSNLNDVLQSLPKQFGGNERIAATLKSKSEIDWASLLNRIESSAPFRAKFLADRGVKFPEISYRDKFELPSTTAALLAESNSEEFMAHLTELSDHKNIEANIAYLKDIWVKAGNQILSKNPESSLTKRSANKLISITPEEIFEQAPIILNRIRRYESQELKIDEQATNKSLEDTLSSHNLSGDYKLWVLDTIDNLTEKACYDIGDRSYPDLETACRAMGKNNGILEEVGLDVHHRDIIAMSSHQIGSKSELIEFSKNIDSNFDLNFKAAEDALAELNHLFTYTDDRAVDLITRRESAKDVIRLLGKGQCSMSEIHKQTTKYIKGVDFEAFCEVAEKIRAEIERFRFDASTRYCEAVINKPVSLNDDIIYQVMVPEDKLEHVIKVAEHYGVNIRDKVTTYNPDIDGDMISKVHKGGVLAPDASMTPKATPPKIKI